MSDRDFRLAKYIRPVHYDLGIEVDLDAWRFRGSAEIELVLQKPTDTIILHAVDLEVSAVRAILPDGKQVSARASLNPNAETVVLQFDRQLPAATVQLCTTFCGEILARLRGFYRSQKDGARYAATQFEAADARRAFPCFDEPEFKARFTLTLNIPSELVAIANGPVLSETDVGNGRKEVRFAATPPISSYLVAYTVGPYDVTPVARAKSGVPVRVFLPKGMADKGIYARDAHQRSLDYLEAYTAIPYPYGKADAIGVPDFEAGAMENPGAITYRLTAIAAAPERASTSSLKGIFYTAAHELTHMWWGDLVTMAWWDDLWLNESFATFVGYKVVADLMPEWGLWRDFVATLARPFSLDALESTHPISFEVKNAKQATERFDVITYWKGAGVVRMIEGFLGADTFRDGVRAYLNRYRERNATADDFWRELSQVSDTDVGTIATAWIKQAGHPVVTVSAERSGGNMTLRIRQERFYADPTLKTADRIKHWPIPMVIKYGTAAGVREKRVLVEGVEATASLPDADWFYPNAEGTGFYRFALEDSAVNALVDVLQSALTPPERLALVGNQWALVKAGRITMAQFFAVLEGFRVESDRAVLSAISGRLFWIGTNLVQDVAQSQFETFVANFYRSQFQQLGWDPRPADTEDDRQRRADVIGALGELASLPEVETEALIRLERYLEESASLDPNLVSTVVRLAARHGDAALYERYLERKRAAATDPEEEQRFLAGLTAFEDSSLIQRSLELSLTDDVRPQDRTHVLARLLGSRTSRIAAWTFARDRWADLTNQMDPMLQQGAIRGLAQVIVEPAVSEIRSFLSRRVTDETRETVAQVVEQLAIDAAACSRLSPEVTSILQRLT